MPKPNPRLQCRNGYAKEYQPLAQASIKAHSGIYIAAGPGTTMDGTLPEGRVVILRWESIDAVRAWYTSPDCVAAHKLGEKYAKYNIVAVNSVP